MIHAYCYIKKYDMSDDLSGHGKYFKNKMIEINNETGLNITIYHNLSYNQKIVLLLHHGINKTILYYTYMTDTRVLLTLSVQRHLLLR